LANRLTYRAVLRVLPKVKGARRVSEESLFREVDEEVRQDQLKQIWARYGNIIIAVCLVVVGAVAGIKGWQYWQLRQSETAAEVYSQAVALIEAGKSDEAAKLVSGMGHQGFAVLARMAEAAALGKAGKTDEAVKLYDAVAADAQIGAGLRDASRIRAAYLLVDTLPPKELEARLAGLNAENNAWRNAVREIIALSAYRTGDYILADRHANEIVADLSAPPSMRQRAQILVQLLTPLLAGKATQ
jgi:hypothetical protein